MFSTIIASQGSPMLAVNADLSKIKYPVLGSAKIDGVRCLNIDGVAISRSRKRIPNRFIQQWFHNTKCFTDGLDGELIIGSPTASDCYRKTVSGVMAADGIPDFKYCVFDRWNIQQPYHARYDTIKNIANDRIYVLPQIILENLTALHKFNEDMLRAGYEGIILRDPNSPYKWGRSTVNEGYLLKVKAFSDAEAVITGFVEEMQNNNEATIAENGRSSRSSNKENLVGKNRLGAWIVTGLTAFKGVSFLIGTGMSEEEKISFWQNKDKYIGKVVKFKYFEHGAYDLPRHAVFLGFRDNIDM